MRLSTTTRWWGKRNDLEDFFAFLDLLKETEYKALNLSFAEFAPYLNDDFDTGAFAQRYLSYGFQTECCHAPVFYPFIFHYSDHQKWKQPMEKALRVAAACGVKYFVMHVGSVIDEKGYDMPKESVEENIVYLRPYLEQAAAMGMTIAIENGTNQPWEGQKPQLMDVSPGFDELVEVVDTLNEDFGREILGICFDCGHANVGHLDLPAAIGKIGHCLKVVHIHDNDGRFDQHLLPYEGNIAWPAVMTALQEIGFDGDLALELYYEKGELQKEPVTYLNHTFRILNELFI